MTPFSGVPQRLLGFADLPIQGNDRNSLLLQFVISGRTGSEIVSVISRVGSARDKVNLFRLEMVLQIGRLLRIADLLQDARNPVAYGVPQETKLVLRNCLGSFDKQDEEGEVDELEAGIEEALGIFRETSAFFEPGEGTLDDPALGDHGEGVQLVAFGHLHGCTQFLLDGFGKGFPCVAAIHQYALNFL